MQGQNQTPGDAHPVISAAAGAVSPGHCSQGLLHHHPCQDPTPHSHVHPQPTQRKGREAARLTCPWVVGSKLQISLFTRILTDVMNIHAYAFINIFSLEWCLLINNA